MTEDRLAAGDVVRRLGGSADRNQILTYSTEHSLRQAILSGRLRRITRGRYTLAELPLAYQAASAVRGLVSHSSAAEHWKLEMLTPSEAVHVTVPVHARPRARRGVVLHFSDVPARDDQDSVTSPLRTVLDCALTLPLPEALAIADSAVRRGLLTSEELIVAAHQRRGPGRLRILRVAELATALAANPFESGLRAIVHEAGITGFHPQQQIRLLGRTIWVDVGDPVRRIALEADSYAFHGSRAALLRDCERYNELTRIGWLLLRFGYDHVTLRADWLAAVVSDTCALPDRTAGRLGITLERTPRKAPERG